MQIIDFTDKLTLNNIPLLLTSVKQLETRTGKPYVTAKFVDKTGNIDAKFWDTTLENFQAKFDGASAGKVFNVSGTVEMGKYTQLNNVSLSPVDPESEAGNPANYEVGVAVPTKEIAEFIKSKMEEVGQLEPDYANLIYNMLYKNTQSDNSFFEQPAAINIHHAFKGGLAYHVYRMLKGAEAMVGIYPKLNKSLLYTAIILHDVGKLSEYATDEYETTETVSCELLGHISIVDGWITTYLVRTGQNLNEPKWQVLRHVILSHHGKLEYGSPVLAKVPEAAMLHQLDVTDAEMMQFETALDSTKDGQMSRDKVFGLGNVRVYHPNFA